MAQPGRALAWGARGRQFKSARPDQLLAFRLPTFESSAVLNCRQRAPKIAPSASERAERREGSAEPSQAWASNLSVATILKISVLGGIQSRGTRSKPCCRRHFRSSVQSLAEYSRRLPEPGPLSHKVDFRAPNPYGPMLAIAWEHARSSRFAPCGSALTSDRLGWRISVLLPN